jgi:uncharacterized protein
MLIHDEWLLTSDRAAIHLPTATAVLADLHLGYNRARCRSGEAVPDADNHDLRRTLQTLRVQHGVRRLVIAGDLCEDGRHDDAVADFLNHLCEMAIDLIGVIPGNHYRGLRSFIDVVPIHPDGLVLGGWRVLHGDGPLPRTPVIQGHIHPCFRWQGRLTAPCFLVSPRRIVLPAFSADAAGTDVGRSTCWRAYRCCVIVGSRVLDFGRLRAR